MKKLIFIALAMLLQVACNKMTQGVSIAFEELGGEVGHKSGYETTNYRSSVSVSGLGQNQIVGSILTVPGRSIPDTYSIPIITGCSKVAVTEYSTEANETDVKKVRDYLDSFIKYNTELVILETEQLILDGFLDSLETKRENSLESNKTKEVIVTLYNLNDVSKKSSSSEIIRELNVEKTQIEKEVTQIKEELLTTKMLFDKARQKSGLVITNWSRNKDSKKSIALGEISSVTHSSDKSKGGYLVLAGIRTESLWLGDDFAMYIAKRKDKLTGSDSILSNHGFIVTFSMTAKHRAYSESLNYKKAFSSRLDTKIEALAKLVGKDYKSYLKQQSLHLSNNIDYAIRSENSGFLSAPKKTLFEYRFISDKAFAKSMIESYKRSDGYLPVYAVRSNIASLKNKVSDVKKDFQYECSVYEKDNKFYNYRNNVDYQNKNINICSHRRCTLVDFKNPIAP
jgi:hypothetical protein